MDRPKMREDDEGGGNPFMGPKIFQQPILGIKQ